MNRQHQKLTRKEQEEQQTASHQQSGQHQTALEFKTPEEALRHDREQTSVPTAVVERLNRSAGDLPKPRRSWWRFWEQE